jgi:hypothetical protein
MKETDGAYGSMGHLVQHFIAPGYVVLHGYSCDDLIERNDDLGAKSRESSILSGYFACMSSCMYARPKSHMKDFMY